MKKGLKSSVAFAIFCSVISILNAEISEIDIIKTPRASNPGNWDWTLILIVALAILVLGIVSRAIALGGSVKKLNK